MGSDRLRRAQRQPVCAKGSACTGDGRRSRGRIGKLCAHPRLKAKTSRANLVCRNVALQMTECEVVRSLGPPASIQIGANERGDRTATMIYPAAERPIYIFTGGVYRRSSAERSRHRKQAQEAGAETARRGHGVKHQSAIALSVAAAERKPIVFRGGKCGRDLCALLVERGGAGCITHVELRVCDKAVDFGDPLRVACNIGFGGL